LISAADKPSQVSKWRRGKTFNALGFDFDVIKAASIGGDRSRRKATSRHVEIALNGVGGRDRHDSPGSAGTAKAIESVLQDEGRGQLIDNLVSPFPRLVGCNQHTLGLGRGQALIPKQDRKRR
jgi:hypothetical protein